MSYALTALLLIRLEARIGEWVMVSDLAQHFGVPAQAVVADLQQVARMRDVGLELRHDGDQVVAVCLEPRAPRSQSKSNQEV